MNLRPLGDRVVLKPVDKEEMTKSGIVIPDTVKEKPQEGIVEAVGTGRILDNGTRVPIEIEVEIQPVVEPRRDQSEDKCQQRRRDADWRR